MPETKNVSGEYKLRVNGTTCLHVTPDGITGTTITANTEFRGTVLTSNATSDVAVKTSGGTQFNVSHVANAVNYLESVGGAVGAGPSLRSSGDRLCLMGDSGGNAVQVATGASYSNVQFLVAHVASAVECLQVTGATSGGTPTLSAQGSSSNIPITLANKGTAVTKLTGQTVQTTVGSAGGASALPATPTGYIVIGINGTDRVIPYYAAS